MGFSVYFSIDDASNADQRGDLVCAVEQMAFMNHLELNVQSGNSTNSSLIQMESQFLKSQDQDNFSLGSLVLRDMSSSNTLSAIDFDKIDELEICGFDQDSG